MMHCKCAIKQVVCIVFLLCLAGNLSAQIDFEKPPVNYGQEVSQDPVAKLIKKMAAGEAKLQYDQRLGWLPSILEHLKIDPESQTFVFSKTSLQLHKISPRTPRALYFNDDVYIGFCQNGEVVEIAATDPNLGAVFYTLDQAEDATKIVADRGQCLTCHATNRTQSVPGYLVRSVYSDFNGRPRSGTRAFVTDHTTEFAKRFGGWYVSGEHGNVRHLGNIVARDRVDPEKMDFEAGANITDLTDLFNTEPYLTSHSDIVAMMVLEHQSQMHNLLARASMETRSAIYHDEGINEALERPKGTMSESTGRRMARACEDVVKYMLFADEISMDSKIQGSTSYAQVFQARAEKNGEVDPYGRSVRQFDLTNRLFKFPCSYMVYSSAFQELPTPMYDLVRKRLYEVLSNTEAVKGYERLSADDRTAVLEILNATLPKLFADLQSTAAKAS
jgi:hypothetical protein